MPPFLGTDIRKQQKYGKRIQASVDNTVNDLRHDFFIKQNTSFLFLSKNIYFWKSIFFKITKNSIVSAFFLPRQMLRNIDMPQRKPRRLPTAEANFERWRD